MSKNFEASLKDLNLLVEKMEKGNISLDELLQQFEQGLGLINHCQSLLKNAEQKISLYDKTKKQLLKFDLKDDPSDSMAH